MTEDKIKRVNRDFDIMVTGKNYLEPVCKAVRYAGLKELIGESLTEKLVDKAYDSSIDKPVFKLRRGLKITFYNRTS